MKTLKEFIDIQETSLSRVWQHVNNKDIPIAILTAFRFEYTKIKPNGDKDQSVNVKRNIQLALEFKNAGFGYFYLDGFWIENKGTANEQHVSEDSIFVVGKKGDDSLLQIAIVQAKKYNQDAIIYKHVGSTEILGVQSDGTEHSYGKFSPDKIGQAYSKLRNRGNRTFVFEQVKWSANWISKSLQNILEKEFSR